MSTKTEKGRSGCLTFLYNTDYETKLGGKCISFDQEEENRTKNFLMRLIGVLMTVYNVVIGLSCFPAMTFVTWVTNWCLIFNMLFVMATMYLAKDWRTVSKGQLAALHIAFEVSGAFNLIVTCVHWTFVHSEVIDNFEGLAWTHMYTVHIFPQIAFLLNWRTMRLSLYSGHWKMFPPITAIYAYINYCEVKRLGKPLYWFLTWEDYTSPLIIAFITLCLALFWVGMAKLTASDASSVSPSKDGKKQK